MNYFDIKYYDPARDVHWYERVAEMDYIFKSHEVARRMIIIKDVPADFNL